MKTRNQRQRKKLHLAEFQELGFLVNWCALQDCLFSQPDFALYSRFAGRILYHQDVSGSAWDGIIQESFSYATNQRQSAHYYALDF